MRPGGDDRSVPGASWQGAEQVDAYLRRRETVIPMIDVQEALTGSLLDRHPHPIERFLDLGSGDGAMSALVLAHRPDAQAVLVDFSEPMLAGVGDRLGERDGRWRTVRGDLSQPAWRSALPRGAYGAAVSGLAIHHLPPGRKRALFGEIFALLAPGGLFVNLDYVLVHGTLKGLFNEQMVANAMHVERGHAGEHAAHREAEAVRRQLADDGVGDEDLPDTAEDQVAWLSGAGFEQAEVHFKWAEAAVFGAVKPTGGEH
jgi:tRNA (cmo5U34)-methyltransferase